MDNPVTASFRWSAEELLTAQRVHMRYSRQFLKLRRARWTIVPIGILFGGGNLPYSRSPALSTYEFGINNVTLMVAQLLGLFLKEYGITENLPGFLSDLLHIRLLATGVGRRLSRQNTAMNHEILRVDENSSQPADNFDCCSARD